MAAGLKPHKRVFAHGWWTFDGQKMSKSLGNVINPHAMIAKFGLDPVRYFLLREVPFGQDGDFSQRAMIGRLNGDLANDFGNLAQRVLSFVQKNAGAAVPQPRRVHAGRQQAAGRRQEPADHRPRRAGRAGLPQGARRAVADRRRRQPLCRRAGAVDLAQDRCGTHEHGAVRADGNAAPARDPQPAVHAAVDGEAAGPARGAAGGARLRGARHGAGGRHRLCRRRRASSRAMWKRALSRRRRRAGRDAGRQPLPSRLPADAPRTCPAR